MIGIWMALAACHGGSDSDDTDTTIGELRTLANCGTDIAGDVPAFYANYFACVEATMAGGDVALHTVDLPPHKSYYWGAGANYEDFDTRDGSYHANPNALFEQDVTVTIPSDPVSKGLTITSDLVDNMAATSDDEYPGGVGVALDGVVVFNSMAAPGDDIAQETFTFDEWEGHPQNTGEYHYHGASPGPLAVLTDRAISGVELFGIMCDGTVLLGCTELDGSAVDQGDLDAQNGHVGDLVDEDGVTHFSGRYHTHSCAGYAHDTYAPEIQYYQDGCPRPNGP